ncbi:hypothetical protein Cgig2_025831 [Carnegiea gigantea]|uniref:Uncharacterized protein n=1 Tax=Carnegiea gigantea TaxID=171969 RepID=A0A9Q1GJ52_9CARY|nr:hypothetical protein Cgig2_025831 [Carnegiea gigantea]
MDGRPSLPPTGEGADAPVSLRGPSILCFLGTDKLTVGLFSRGTREGAGKKKLTWPSLDLHETNRKLGQHQTHNRSVLEWLSTLSDILKNQKAGRSEKEVRVVHRSSVAGSPKGLQTGFPSFQSGTSPQLDSRHRKRKSYFQYYSFDFFLMVVMKPVLFTIPNPDLLGGLLNRVNQAKCPGRAGPGKWLPGLPYGSERIWAPGNSSPSATISVTGGARPVCLGTDSTGPDDDLVGELIEAPSEDELCEECPEAELPEPDREEVLELEEATSASGLCHPANLEVRHIVSNGDLPRVRHFHLRAKNAGGGGVLAARPRGCARLKKGNNIGNLFRLPTLILSGGTSHHLAINKGRQTRELRVPTLYLGASLPLMDVPTRQARRRYNIQQIVLRKGINVYLRVHRSSTLPLTIAITLDLHFARLAMKLRFPDHFVHNTHPSLEGVPNSAVAASASTNEKHGYNTLKSSERGQGGREALLQRQVQVSLT